MPSYKMGRGTSLNLNVQVNDSTTGIGANLTGGSLWFTAKTAKGLADPGTFQKTVGAGITLLSQTSTVTRGGATVAIVPADTTGLSAAVDTLLYYDLKYKDVGGEEVIIETGTIRVQAVVTLAT